MRLFTITCALAPVLSFAAPSPYSYEPGAPNGPENWGSLPVYPNNECNGDHNSPIDITASRCNSYRDYTFTVGSCQSINFGYELSDHNVEVVIPADCDPYTMRVPRVSTTFVAKQFHIHTFSEHSINGEHAAAELHIVHVDANNATADAVLGIMITPESRTNHEMFDLFLAGWEATAAETAAHCSGTTRKTSAVSRDLLTADINIYDLIPEKSSFYVYSGGLTTPPCSQIVLWNFADKPLQISVSQYRRLVNLILGYVNPTTCALATVASSAGSTSRPPVPINGRTVHRICPRSLKPNRTAT